MGFPKQQKVKTTERNNATDEAPGSEFLLAPTPYRLSYGRVNASDMLWDGNEAHDARGLGLCHQRCKILE